MKENYYVVELSFDEFMDQVKYMAGEMVNDPSSPYKNTKSEELKGKSVAAVITQILIQFLDDKKLKKGKRFRLDVKPKNGLVPYLYISGRYGEFDQFYTGYATPIFFSYGYTDEDLEISNKELSHLAPALELMYRKAQKQVKAA